ncbi:DCC1-like thiol-disulfide oxidoreductase family protein [Bradyrhizobium prioriisuperbiae]|uniref:DCC1-like thiol-disulfide oxidoreductase family protein n=1 Tax=Bradyrhizobium prioriisuperbiae TaxID=2854389 RepID=UPI0028EEBE38|nr:DCC1-like thiol-disulfide oxidoreductase family protein [Bradyrhizobium prioritasuperba]
MRGQTIGVAGCGLAGLATALLLHRAGHRVTLFERFTTPKPLGSGLMIQTTGLAVLREMALDQAVLAAGAQIDRLFGKAVPSGRTVLDVRYAALGGTTAFGIGIHRAALFDVLYQAVLRAGITIETGRIVTAAPNDGDGRRHLAFSDGTSAGPFDLVVDTLGLASPLTPAAGRTLAYGALWASLDWPHDAGFDPHALEQRYVRASTMVGVLPIGAAPGAPKPQTAFFWSLRGDQLETWRQRGLETWKDDVRKVWPATAPLLDQIDTPERLTFAAYAHRTTAAPAEPGLIHIGDAWHAASPQLGQGANMAFLDAYALARALRDSETPAHAVPRAIALRRRHVRTYQAMSALFTPVYQSDGHLLPLLRDRIAGPLTKLWPATRILAAMVAGLIGWPLRPLGLARATQAPRTTFSDIAGHDPLIVFDGECVLCSTQAQFVLRHDHARRFRLTTAQGEVGRALYGRLGLPTDVYHTMLLISDDRALMHSDAVLAIAGGLGWPWRVATIARIVPRALRDRLYRFVARNRYRWFGRHDVCWRPAPDVMDRIL